MNDYKPKWWIAAILVFWLALIVVLLVGHIWLGW